MPTYDYVCDACEHAFEEFQSFSDAPLTKHKGCGGKLTKVLSPAGIVLKGSGFYKTDNRSGSKRSNGRDGGGRDAGSGRESSSSESKSADASSASSGSGSGDAKKSSSGSGGSSPASKKPAAERA